MRRRAVYHDQAIRYFQQLHYRRYGILFETLEIYSSAKLALTGGFKGEGQGGIQAWLPAPIFFVILSYRFTSPQSTSK